MTQASQQPSGLALTTTAAALTAALYYCYWSHHQQQQQQQNANDYNNNNTSSSSPVEEEDTADHKVLDTTITSVTNRAEPCKADFQAPPLAVTSLLSLDTINEHTVGAANRVCASGKGLTPLSDLFTPPRSASITSAASATPSTPSLGVLHSSKQQRRNSRSRTTPLKHSQTRRRYDSDDDVLMISPEDLSMMYELQRLDQDERAAKYLSGNSSNDSRDEEQPQRKAARKVVVRRTQ